MANTSINLVGLDFETIKSNLIQYLKQSDSPLRDVNYEGSNISQLIDLLSYNTYLNGYYLNMIGSEMFLDSAQIRDTIVSHAKELNYVPRSFNSARAEISFQVYPSPPIDSLLIPKGTTFTTKIGSNNYSFATDDNLIFNASPNGSIVVQNLAIYEGSYIVESFVYDSSNNQQRFVLSNPTLDTRSISVVVVEDNGTTTLPHSRALSFLGINANSQIYFLQAAENSQYEIVFGDGVIGRKPKSGSVIVAEYRVCNGELPNGASIFDIDGPIQGQNNIQNIITNVVATGGAVAETNESIKYNAPRAYQNQERAVTASDYENLLTQNFPEIQAISAYGGEEANPPQYGKVFIAVDVQDADGVPELTKRKFYNFIKPRSPVSIDPVIIEPEFMFVEVDTSVKYNINTTTLKENDIKALVLNTISAFNLQSLSDFKSTLRYSKFVKAIDDTHPSILSNETTLTPYKSMVPVVDEPYTVTFDYGFEITQNPIPESENDQSEVIHNIYSTTFIYNNNTAYIEDDGIGNLWLISTQQGTHARLSKIGSVDYSGGLVSVSGLIIQEFAGSQIKLYARPVSFDITSEKNVILSIRDSDIIINTIQIRE